MLNIQKRIELIETLLNEDTSQSLTYAALECRLTLEYICYERFKLTYAYLSPDDLKNWQPKHVVKQVLEDIDSNITNELMLSISTESTEGKSLKTKEDFEALEYIALGTQSALNINSIHKLWNGLSSVALHIPVPSIGSDELQIYQDKENIKTKVKSVIDLLSGIKGNLLMGGSLSEVFSFDCHACETTIKRPMKNLVSPSVVNCINPKCEESYLLEPSQTNKNIGITRRIFRFKCQSCNEDLEVPVNIFRELRFDQKLDIRCANCNMLSEVIMRPFVKNTETEKSHNK